MILIPENIKSNLFKTIVEFSYAEYGSALEMLAAAKKTDSPKLKIGYINHALDEYRHTELLHKVLNYEIKKSKALFEKEFKFIPQNVILKGYLDKKSFLIEKYKLKNFVEFVYTNEFLAKESFENLIKRIGDSKSIEILNSIVDEEENHADFSMTKLNEIMKDEDRHWGFAKLFYNKKFPNSNLNYAFRKERIKNKLRMFYFKNLAFLNKIFDPIINFIISVFGIIVKFLKVNSTKNRNLMEINSRSIL